MNNDLNCDQVRPLLDAYVDGELDVLRSLDIERHLQSCPACSTILNNRQALHSALSDDSLYFRASDELQKRLHQKLRQADRPITPTVQFSRWWGVAAGLVTVLAVVAVVWLGDRPGIDQTVAGEVLSAHLRSLMPGHLEDVVSTDQHTVKPWFDGKLDFSPPVIDLSTQGFPLAGGRLDYLDNRPVAALVYQRFKHVINVFIWPASDQSRSSMSVDTSQGYELLHWTQAGMTYWAVSDVNASDLQMFVGLLQNAIAENSSTPEGS